jgi:hypothetical protein
MALSPPMPSPIVPRASQIARHLPTSRSSGSWTREHSGNRWVSRPFLGSQTLL